LKVLVSFVFVSLSISLNISLLEKFESRSGMLSYISLRFRS
jgi:hypothetical protein